MHMQAIGNQSHGDTGQVSSTRANWGCALPSDDIALNKCVPYVMPASKPAHTYSCGSSVTRADDNAVCTQRASGIERAFELGRKSDKPYMVLRRPFPHMFERAGACVRGIVRAALFGIQKRTLQMQTQRRRTAKISGRVLLQKFPHARDIL